MAVSDYFAADYSEARGKFQEAARSASAKVTEYALPNHRGPANEVLATDVAVLGPVDAERALLLISGTHGVEGFCGSGCQVGFLQDQLYQALPSGTRVILIHALNPYGFAYLRRVNEDNVDVNRNFQDFSKPLPLSTAYEEIHDWLIPPEWAGPRRQAADQAIQQFIGQRGMPAFQAAVSGGQYTRPTGLFYGGTQVSWSNQTFHRILQEHLPRAAKRVACIDFHTGLGPTGYGEPICGGRGEADLQRARRWYGPEVTNTAGGSSTSAVVTGSLLEALDQVGSGEKTSIALEFGTRPMLEVLTALRADHWLHGAPDRPAPVREEIKRFIRTAFYVDAPAWKAAVYGRAADIVTRAARGLAA